jgi:hypothetical protein
MRLGLDFLRGEEMEPLPAGITGLLFGAFVSAFGRRIRSRNATKPTAWPTATNLQNAVSTGRLPEGAAPDQWAPELVRIAQQEKQLLWAGPIFLGLFAAIGVFLIFDDPAHPWYGGLLGTGFLAMAIWCPISILRRRKRIGALLAQFPEEPNRTAD